mmetsp:Transcript_13166/g.15931  ORF Transcript_13166/g.15931 Transcript_13166/m.15931 type:complete len:243 (+) Transcript_13166:297-1025(+)
MAANKVATITRREVCAWITAGCAVLLWLQSRRQRCPYVWHGGAPGGNPAGSCWIGASDNYAMCTPSLAIDLVIEHEDKGVILVRRKDNGLYATMGGFVDVGERLHDTVRRELAEETGLELLGEPLLLGVFGDPRRDKRRHTVSIVYIARTAGQPRPGSDVKQVEIVPFSKIDDIPLAFDHQAILDDYLRWRNELHSYIPLTSLDIHGEEDINSGFGDNLIIKRDTCIIGAPLSHRKVTRPLF